MLMLTQRELFLQHCAQTSQEPLLLEFEKAEGMYLYNKGGRKFMDIIAGISVSNLGHRHPKVIQAIKDQLDKYTYLMVYGEYVTTPQVQFSTLLSEQLPERLSCTYLVNSGSEAVEGALKLAKRYTGRQEIIAFNKAYHGSTHGALSVIGDESYRRSFRPLLPMVKHLDFNTFDQINQITEHTACVILEPIQGEAGIIVPKEGYLKAIRNRCDEVGTLLIFDEIQTGFGRTGTLFAFEQFDVIPDILTLAKGMGGGMPIGGFVASYEIMQSLTNNPILGHISTFGGHPVSCAAALASLQVLLDTPELIASVKKKEALFRANLTHPAINSISSFGLMIALEFDDYPSNKAIIDHCIANGVLTDWFLFSDNKLRIAPPLIITEEEILASCKIISNAIAQVII